MRFDCGLKIGFSFFYLFSYDNNRKSEEKKEVEGDNFLANVHLPLEERSKGVQDGALAGWYRQGMSCF